MCLISEKMTIEEIIRTWPEMAKVFARYKVDICCGGGHSLEFVAQKHGLNLGAILEQLNDLASAATAKKP